MTDGEHPDATDRAESAISPDSDTRAPDAKPPHPSYLFLTVVSVVSLAADLATKAWAKAKLEDGLKHVQVIPGYVSLLFAKNKGGAWGLLQEESESIRKPFFLLISLAAIAFIFSLYRRLTMQQTALKWGLPLVLGGALGNLIDRIRYGHVIDFIDVRITSTYHWPTFNVADIAICVGVGLMAVDMFSGRKKKPGKMWVEEQESDAPESDAPPPPAARTAAAEDRAEGA